MGVVAGLLGGFKVKGSGPFTIKDELKTIGGLVARPDQGAVTIHDHQQALELKRIHRILHAEQ